VALGAPRRTDRSRDLVAGPQLAAADLRRGDVNVAAGGRERVAAQEAAAVGKNVEHAGARLGVGLDLVVRRLGLAIGPGARPRGRVPLAALTPCAGRAAARHGLVLAGLLGFGAPAAARPPGATRAPGVLARGLSVPTATLCGTVGLAGVLDDRGDQLVAAQAPKAFDSELGGDRMQVGERAALELAAVEDGHAR